MFVKVAARVVEVYAARLRVSDGKRMNHGQKKRTDFLSKKE